MELLMDEVTAVCGKFCRPETEAACRKAGSGKMGSAMEGEERRDEPAMAEPILHDASVAETEKQATLNNPAA